jgi:hypothetical protein
VEGDRVQQEMARYAHQSETVSASLKLIAEHLGQWHEGPTIVKTDNVRLETNKAIRTLSSSLETVAALGDRPNGTLGSGGFY